MTDIFNSSPGEDAPPPPDVEIDQIDLSLDLIETVF
jgi:hypothetical protein